MVLVCKISVDLRLMDDSCGTEEVAVSPSPDPMVRSCTEGVAGAGSGVRRLHVRGEEDSGQVEGDGHCQANPGQNVPQTLEAPSVC